MNRISSLMILPLAFMIVSMLENDKQNTLLREAEFLYDKSEFSALINKIKELRQLQNLDKSILGAISRLEGHICLFGQGKNGYIDLSCAWKKYIDASRKGDAEGLFYTAFLLKNLLFDSLEPLKDQFGSEISLVDSTSTLNEKIKLINAIAYNMYYLSSIGNFPLALKYIGNNIRLDPIDCLAAVSYYTKAADFLLSYFNESFYDMYEEDLLITNSVKPFAKRKESTLSIIKFNEAVYSLYNRNAENSESQLSTIAFQYLLYREYDLAKNLAERLMKKNQYDRIANYIMGVLYMTGNGVPIDYNSALSYFNISSLYQNTYATNALGYMYMNGLGVKKNETLALEHFTQADRKSVV